MRRRPVLLLALLAGGSAAALAAGPAAVPVAAPPGRAPVQLVVPGGTNPLGTEEEAYAVQPAPIADRDTVADQVRYAKQAAALPLAVRNRSFTGIGPFGMDDPKDSPTGALRFARSAGMGTALAVDPRDPDVVYTGTMGGLWKSTDAGSTWRALGDRYFARSAVGAIAVDPRRPDTVYVGTGIGKGTISGDAPGSGVYVSRDGGRTFSRPAKNTRGYGTNAILVADSGVLVATTDGLYRSSDAGRSFVRVPLPTNATHSAPAKGPYANWVSDVVASPTDARVITVAVGSPFGRRLSPEGKPLSVGNGLYRSTTGAAGRFTWMPSSAGLTHPAASDDPIGRVQLSYGLGTGERSVLWAIVSDAGFTNRMQPGGLDEVAATTGQSLNRTNTMLNGLYRSTDNGGSWTVKATPQSLQSSVNSGLGYYPALGYGIGVQAYYNLWVEADPVQPDQVYFGLEEVFQSVSGTGDTPGLGYFEIIQRYWDVCGASTYLENVFEGLACPDETPKYGGVSTHPDQHVGVAVRTPSGVRLYTGNDGGYFRQDSHAIDAVRQGFDNDGWVQMNTVPSVQPYKVDRKPDGEYVIGLQDNGGSFFRPGGTSMLTSSGDGLHAIATSDPDVFYFAAQGAILWVTEDHGQTIRDVQPNLDTPAFGSPIAMDPTDEDHLVAAARDVQETTKGPRTQTVLDPVAYTVVATDWTSSFTFGTSPTKQRWTAQAISVRGASTYVGICGLCRNGIGDPELIRTTVATNVKPGCTAKKQSSDCWHVAAGKGLPKVGISALVQDPANPRTVYATFLEGTNIGYDPKVVGSQRVMVSRDAGETWKDITGNLPRSSTRDIAIRDGRLVVASDHGVFTAPLTGQRWSRLAAGLPPVRVYDLSLDPTARYLSVAAYGRGVYVLDFGRSAASSRGPGPKGAPKAASAVGSATGGHAGPASAVAAAPAGPARAAAGTKGSAEGSGPALLGPVRRVASSGPQPVLPALALALLAGGALARARRRSA